MNLSVTPRQEQLVRDLRAVLDSRAGSDWEELVSTTPGFDAQLWAQLLAGGWPAVGFPEEAGGHGGGVTDLVAVMETLGSGPVPTPIHGGIVLSGRALLAASSEGHRLRSLLEGRRSFAFCHWEGESDRRPPTVEATPSARGWRLDGLCRFVPYGDDVDELMVLARVHADGGRNGLTLFAVDRSSSGVAAQPVPSLGGDRLCHVSFTAVQTAASSLIGEVGGALEWLPGVLDVGRVAVVAEMVGAASAALAHACRRAGSRQQFGAPIGSLQAVQHRLADAFIDVVTARDAVYDAAGIIDRGEDSRVAVAEAKAYCSDACRRVTAAAHQVCGGEGIYADQPLHVWHRRVAALVPALGTVPSMRAAVASVLLAR